MYSEREWISSLIILGLLTIIKGNNVTSTTTTTSFSTFSTSSTSSSISCESAKLKCAYRTGCGSALEQYLTNCIGVFEGDTNNCPENCQHALIALTSTDEGKDLMTCQCAKEDTMCLQSKQRVEICRSSINSVMNRTRISCRIATWICKADALCSTALYYYHGFCRSMFLGKKCNHRCRNSIGILTRQEKAAKLNTCICDGAEDYDCKSIHRNMNTLCFNKNHHENHHENHEIDKLLPDTRTNEISRSLHSGTTSSNYFPTTNNIALGLGLLIFFVLQD